MNTSVGRILRIALLSILCAGLLAPSTVAEPQRKHTQVKATGQVLLPDLKVTDVTMQGNRFLVITLTNAGKGEIPEEAYRPQSVFAFNVKVDGKAVGVMDLATIDPDRRLKVPGGTLTWKFDLKGSKALKNGVHNIKVKANWRNKLKEAEGADKNNVFEKNLGPRKVVRTNGVKPVHRAPPSTNNTQPKTESPQVSANTDHQIKHPQVSSKVVAGKFQPVAAPSYPMKVSLVNPRWSTTDNLMIIIAFNLEPRVSTLSKPGAIEVRQVEGTRKGNPLQGRVVMTDGKSLKWYSNVSGWLCSKDRVCKVEVTISDIVTDKWGRMLDGDSSGRPGGNYVKTLTVNTGGVMGPPDLAVCLTSVLNVIGTPGGFKNDIFFKVTNRSTQVSPPAELKIEVEGKKTTIQMVPSIPAEGTVYVKRTVTFFRGGKTLNYSASIDPRNLISESHENNNSISGTIHTHGHSYLDQNGSSFTEQAQKNHINSCS